MNAENIETIFDHSITEAEQELLLGTQETVESYLDGLSPNGVLADLYLLYELRGDMQKSNGFLEKITDENYRSDISLSSCALSLSYIGSAKP